MLRNHPWAFLPTLLIFVLVEIIGFFVGVCMGIYYLANGDPRGALTIVGAITWLYAGSWLWCKKVDPC